ncbi:beta strand repeat-containing protein, partial [Chryseotalea sanaruensis]|uniref:beta strand repeat-containing protein n=1 Tax=Chryseotalea sanaruensis TaxID=2482724 RepID=UPI0011D05F1D
MKRVFTNVMGKKFCGAIVLLVLFFVAGESLAQGNFESNASGNWTVVGTWTLVSGSDGDGIPDANDNVVIRNTHTVTVSNGGVGPTVHECNNITINNGGILRTNSGTAVRTLRVSGSLTISAGGTLTVVSSGGTVTHFIEIAGDFTNNGGTFSPLVGNDVVQVIFNGTGAQAINGTSVTQTFNNVIVNKSIGTTLTVSGSTTTLNAVNFEQTSGNFTAPATTDFSGNITLTSGNYNAGVNTSIGGNFTNNGVSFISGAGTVSFDGITQEINGSSVTTFNNLTTIGSTILTTGVATIIGGDLSIGDGTTFSLSGFDLTVNGTTTIGAGASGVLSITSSTGTKIFEGLVTISTNGFWNNAANESVTFRGGITNNGLFTTGSALQTFDTNNQALTGSFIIPSIGVNGIILTNNGSVEISNNLSGTGNFFQAVGATLNLRGATTIASLTASSAGNSVEYSGNDQDVFGTTYADLVLNQSAGEASLGSDVVVEETLTLTSRNFNLAGYHLEFGALATAIAGGPFSSSKMIIATGGSEVRKSFNSAGSFTFPIGDNTGLLEYSPIQLTSSGASTIGVSIVDAKHPNNSSATNFLSRYWNIVSSSPVTVDVIATYLNTDITGSEGLISTAQLDGTFNRDSNPWVKSTVLDAGNNEAEFVGAVLTTAQTSAFTGILSTNPVAAINTGAGVTICEGDVQALLASVSSGGDAPFTYSWSPATALSATNIANPSANPVADVIYTVTVTDANGIEDTEITTITVNPRPVAPVVTFTTNTYCVGATITPPTTAGSGLQWWSDATLLTLLPTVDPENPIDTELGFSTIAAGTTTVYVTETVLGCRGPATAITLTVRANPIADAGAASIDVCEGDAVALGGSPTATAGAGSYTYSWSPATGLNNATIANPTLTASSAGNVVYTVTVTDANTCQSTDNITVNTLALPAAPAVTFTPSTYCTGATLTAPTTAGTALQWWSDVTLTSPLVTVSPTNPTGAELGFSTASAGITTVFVTQTVNGCRSVATPVTLNVISGITASLVSNDGDNIICDGTTVLFTATPIGAASYDFILNGNFGTPIQSGVSNTFSTNTLNDGDELEVVVTGGGGCTDVSNGIISTVIPTATVNAVANQVLCNGDNSTLVTFTGSNSTSYTWTNDNTSIGLAASGTGNINSFVSTNTGISPLVATITVTANNGLCVGTSQVFTVTVNPTPALSSSLTPAAICSGDTFSYTPASVTVGATFSWSRAVVVGITEAAGTGTNDPNETLTNTTSLPIN